MLAFALKIVLGVTGLNGSLGMESCLQQSAPSAPVVVQATPNSPSPDPSLQSGVIIRRLDPHQFTIATSSGNSTFITFRGEKIKVLDLFHDLVHRYEANLVFAPKDVPDVEITLNIHEMPLEDGLIAIASVVGGYWTNVNGIYAFHRGDPPSNRPGVLRNESRVSTFQGRLGALQGNSSTTLDLPLAGWSTAPSNSALSYTATTTAPVRGEVTIQETAAAPAGVTTFRSDSVRISPAAPAVKRDRVQTITTTASGQAVELPSIVVQDRGAGAFASRVFVTKFVEKSTSNLLGLVDTLSSKQKKLITFRGYLKVSDLTAHQKALLGSTKGLKELKLEANHKKLTIRN